jgi:hypothetical protein
MVSEPFTKLFKAEPEYSNLRVFSCACYPLLRPYNKHKLEFRSKRCIFLGYSSNHKGYRCMDPTTSRVYLSRNVVFDETCFPARRRSPLHCLPTPLPHLLVRFFLLLTSFQLTLFPVLTHMTPLNLLHPLYPLPLPITLPLALLR